MNEESQHLILWRGKQSGPFALRVIRNKLSSGELSRAHQIKVDQEWVFLGEYLDRLGGRSGGTSRGGVGNSGATTRGSRTGRGVSSSLPVETRRPEEASMEWAGGVAEPKGPGQALSLGDSFPAGSFDPNATRISGSPRVVHALRGAAGGGGGGSSLGFGAPRREEGGDLRGDAGGARPPVWEIVLKKATFADS
jgi:hypothetical protein